MKIDRHGQAKILTPDEIQLLFNQSGERKGFGTKAVFCRSAMLSLIFNGG
jgi:hypothetical protein